MIDQNLNTKLKIKISLFYPFHRSSVYKYKEYKERTFSTNEKLAQLEFLWFIEQIKEDIISEEFTEEQNESLKARMIYQCMRYNVIDSIYKYLNKQKKIKKYYDFINQNKLKELQTQDIPYCKLSDYYYLRSCLDYGYTVLNHQFRDFYIDYLLVDLNKEILKEAKEMNKVVTEDLFVQKDRFIRFIFEQYQPLLPKFPLKDPEKINFTHLFESVIKNNSTWNDFLQKYNKKYPLLFKDNAEDRYINLVLQTRDYKEQIAIYLSFMLKLIKSHPNISFENIHSKPLSHDVYYSPNEDERNSFYATIIQESFSPIEINIQKEDISLRDINRYIAFLVQMERYFYKTLEAMFIIILYKNKVSATDDVN